MLHLAKGQNPIACSQACANVKKAPGKKTVLLLLDDAHDNAHSVENNAWLYDTDFEFLNDPDILQVTTAGPRHWDTAVRLLMAGLPPRSSYTRKTPGRPLPKWTWPRRTRYSCSTTCMRWPWPTR